MTRRADASQVATLMILPKSDRHQLRTVAVAVRRDFEELSPSGAGASLTLLDDPVLLVRLVQVGPGIICLARRHESASVPLGLRTLASWPILAIGAVPTLAGALLI